VPEGFNFYSQVRFENGEAIAHYSDGVDVPEPLEGIAYQWEAGYPLANDENSTCVVIKRGKMRNVPCEGYFNGTDDALVHLGYICEARILETIPDKDDGTVETCHMPFKYKGITYDHCASPDVDPKIIREGE